MYRFVKRFCDLFFALIALAILAPLLTIIAVILKFTGEGDVFYRQQRIGVNNQEFLMWKFATMLRQSASMGSGYFTLRNDSRVTRFGRFLRITKLNELPQLFNIVAGDMSMVGPRPLVPPVYHLYSDNIRNGIMGVIPGLTGIGSIVFRDEEAIVSGSALTPHECYKQVIMPYKGALELWYQQHISFKTDLLLLLLTIWYIFAPGSNLVFKVFKTLPKQGV